jgi:hypothetical protein
MNYYYADTANQPVGPLPKDELHSLYREGTIGLETQIIPEGSEDWHQYRAIAVPLPPSASERALVPIGRHSRIVETTLVPLAQTATTTCPFCAEPIAAAAKKCKHCGETLDVALRAAEEAKRSHSQAPMVFMNAGGGSSSAAVASPIGVGGGYSKGTAVLLALFFGTFGAHKFYLGQTFQGFIYLLFCWTGIPTALGIIEAICYLSHSQAQWIRRYGS